MRCFLFFFKEKLTIDNPKVVVGKLTAGDWLILIDSFSILFKKSMCNTKKVKQVRERHRNKYLYNEHFLDTSSKGWFWANVVEYFVVVYPNLQFSWYSSSSSFFFIPYFVYITSLLYMSLHNNPLCSCIVGKVCNESQCKM